MSKGIPLTPLIAISQLNRFLSESKVENCIKLALESIMREMINDIKDSGRAGRWTDRTGNLRDSIFQVVLEPNKSERVTIPDGTVSVRNTERDMIIGVVVAGMEYAIFVEIHPNFSVLQETFNKWQSRIAKELNARIKICIRIGKDSAGKLVS